MQNMQQQFSTIKTQKENFYILVQLLELML